MADSAPAPAPDRKSNAPATLDYQPTHIDQQYRYWRFRLLFTSLVGYAVFYFVRTNISVPLPVMGRKLHYSKEELGIILTAGGVTYGVSKFLNGFLGDWANPRYFMAIGLLACAGMNVAFGMSSSLVLLTSFWILNNWAQGMGFPPCAKTMGYWFSPKERSTTFGIWHTSHTIGAFIISVLTGYLIHYFGNWRLCFFVPAGIAVGMSVFLFLSLRDTPESMGLPPVEVYKGEESAEQLAAQPSQAESYWSVVWKYVLTNKYMWIISIANLLVYTLRSASASWGPTFLQELKHVTPLASGWMTGCFELCGMVSALLAGYVADHWFGGRAGRVCVIAMTAMTVIVYGFWRTAPSHPVSICVLFLGMGFMIYVPQMLIAAMAMNLATKRAAAAAVGMTGIFGYASTIVSGVGLGGIVDRSGWNGAFILLIAVSAATAMLMLLTWNVGAHTEPEEL